MRLTNEELYVLNFLLQLERKTLSEHYDKTSTYTAWDFECALLGLAGKLRKIRHSRANSLPLDVDLAINRMIESHKKKQLVLSTPESVGPETN